MDPRLVQLPSLDVPDVTAVPADEAAVMPYAVQIVPQRTTRSSRGFPQMYAQQRSVPTDALLTDARQAIVDPALMKSGKKYQIPTEAVAESEPLVTAQDASKSGIRMSYEVPPAGSTPMSQMVSRADALELFVLKLTPIQYESKDVVMSDDE